MSVSSPSSPFGPAEIRALRGSLSRPRFAALLGVSPNTVYRWELSPRSPHHLSPSLQAVEALQRLARAGGAAPTPPAAASTERLPIMWRGSSLERGPLARAYLALIESRYPEALALVEDCEQRGLTSDQRAEAAALRAGIHLLGRADAAAAQEALAPFREAPARDELGAHARALVSLWLGFALGWPDGRLQDRPRALALLHGARAELWRQDERGSVFWADVAIGLVHFSVYEIELARRHFTRCITHDMQGARAAARMWLHEVSGHLARIEGDYRQSALAYGKALNEAERAGDTYVRARALAFICERRMEACDPIDTCLAAGGEARALYRSLGDPFDFPSRCMLRALGEACWRAGRFDQLRAVVAPAAARLEANGDSPYLLYEQLGRAALRQGDFAAARAHLGACRRLTGPIERSFGLVMADMLEAAILQGECRLPEALEAWATARRGAELFGSVPLRGNIETGRTDTLIDAGDAAGARVALASAERDLSQVRAPWLHARLTRVRARLMALEGRFAAARVLGLQAADALERAADPFGGALLRSEVEKWPAHAEGETPLVPGAALERICAAGTGGPTRVLSELCAVCSEGMGGHAFAVRDARGELLAQSGAPGADLVTVASFGDRLGQRYELAARGGEAPGHLRALLPVVELALEAGALREGTPRAPERAPDEPPAWGMVVTSAPMRRLTDAIRRIGRSRATVLITGESGTGKELVARALHTVSGRPGKHVSFNCAAVPPALFESQLFGHVRGAFTGADRDFEGFVRAAHGGTLFLDEVGELPLEVQPKLLRFLEEGTVDPVGATQPRAVDVRVIAATHQNLEERVRQGRFREDLFYRLNVIPLRVPPLRERADEIPALVRHFLVQLCGPHPPRVTEQALAELSTCGWPGNVRQLRNELERVVALHGSAGAIVPEMLSEEVRTGRRAG